MTDTTKRHVVTSGETLGQIARDNNTTIKEIQAVNPTITDPDKIFAGQVILIPIQAGGEAGGSTGSSSSNAGPPPAPGAVVSGMDANLPLTNHIDCLKGRGF